MVQWCRFAEFSRILQVVAALSVFVAHGESICWNGGEWDESGAPDGVLLSDNAGWWGRCVFTGVTYSYEEEPSSPRDVLGGDKSLFGRRLLDGDKPVGWHRPVGQTKKRPLSVVFDFKRPCIFSEVDILSARTTNAVASIAVSADGRNWVESAANSRCIASRTRIRLSSKNGGRYLRLSYTAENSSITYLDEVLVWGSGEVSQTYPENISPIKRGAYLKFSERRNGELRFVPLKDPTAASKVKTGMPPFSLSPDKDACAQVTMARNETEVRYFALVNESSQTATVPVKATGFGKNLTAELRIGGVVRTQPPKRKLTEKQRFDLQLTGAEPEDAFDADKMDVIPFFAAGMTPQLNFARKYLANPEQVANFPESVQIEPGECAVLMLRLVTAGASARERTVFLSAGKARYEVPVKVMDVTLPDSAPWIFAWGAFTRQFPFESRTRYENEAKPLRELGVTMTQGLPLKGTKAALVASNRGKAKIYHRVNLGRKILDKTYRGKGEFDDEDRRLIRERVEELRKQSKECGVSSERVVLEISDEPDLKRARMFGDVCRYLRKIAPDMSIYMNPCFWTGKGFTPPRDIVDSLKDYYNECVDVSVPYRSLVEEAESRNSLWTSPRRVNAQYAHPAHRAGRSIAWSSFRYGLDGFGYWSYYSPTGNPWDIRTWKYWSYECQLAFPLENGVALTPVYEEMREAYEDWLLLSLLREKGRTEALNALLKEFADSFDIPNRETARPYACDFSKLRLKALAVAQ